MLGWYMHGDETLMVCLSLFVHVLCWPNNMIYISTWAEFQGNHKYTIHVSHDLFIIEKSVKYRKNSIFFIVYQSHMIYNQYIHDCLEIPLKLIYMSDHATLLQYKKIDFFLYFADFSMLRRSCDIWVVYS